MISGILCAFSRQFSAPSFVRCTQNLNGTLNGLLSSQLTNKLGFSTLTKFSSPALTSNSSIKKLFKCSENSLLDPKQVDLQQVRTVIKFSMKDGKKIPEEIVLKKFFRLHWGIWIRNISGRYKRLWKKSGKQRRRYLQHVFCNATQSRMLDKMVTKEWRRPRYYIEDPYAPYHKREEFYFTRKKPWRPEGCDYE